VQVPLPGHQSLDLGSRLAFVVQQYRTVALDLAPLADVPEDEHGAAGGKRGRQFQSR
jgi:hypothetical protein